MCGRQPHYRNAVLECGLWCSAFRQLAPLDRAQAAPRPRSLKGQRSMTAAAWAFAGGYSAWDRLGEQTPRKSGHSTRRPPFLFLVNSEHPGRPLCSVPVHSAPGFLFSLLKNSGLVCVRSSHLSHRQSWSSWLCAFYLRMSDPARSHSTQKSHPGPTLQYFICFSCRVLL